MKQFIIPVLCVYLIGCNENDSRKNDKTIADQEEKIKELEQQLEEKEASQAPRDTRNPNYDVYKDPDLVQIDLGKYVFAIIETEKQVTVKTNFSNGMPTTSQKTIRVTKVSDIQRIEYFNDDKKQRFKDLVRQRASMAEYTKPKIFSVDVKEFSSYSEASKARERLDFSDEIAVVLPYNF